MRNRIFLIVALLVAILGYLSPDLGATSRSIESLNLPPSTNPIVVELFTSQSCSSCPPADEVLAGLAKNKSVIALGCHVTYWDHLNWRDTLSREFCTNRQRSYAAFSGTSQVYTPQMIINGGEGFVGSNQNKAVEYITKNYQSVRQISIDGNANGKLVITLPNLEKKSKPQTLWLISYQARITQNIGSGENGGRTITYVNPVEELTQIGTWSGEAKTMEIQLPDTTQNNQQTAGYVIIGQLNGYGPISAAGKLEILIN